MRRSLHSYASAVIEEFPAVKAHVLAMLAADQAAKMVGAEPDQGLVPF
jgi:hypothetical protein